ncbi:MAG: sigma 54-interacting transcriptional regulator, partial [Desulfobacterales bacterium]
TGAERRKEGCFVLAGGGSLFLDEVSEMTVTMQVKLLRVIQEREVVRVGGETPLPVDVRVICATNKSLEDLVRQGRFREDLYYRLNVVGLSLPPLRGRREDIPLLAQHFSDVFAERNRKPVKGFTPRAMDAILKHAWPGNVRELMNAVERGVVLTRGDYLDLVDLRMAPRPSEHAPAREGPATADPAPLEEVERAAILRAFEMAGGNKSEAARQLGITRKTLHKKLLRYAAAARKKAAS